LARNRHYGQLIENITIDNAGAEGKCIARWEGKVIFVSYAAPGDIVDLKIIGRKRKFLIGEIVKFHQKSTDRIEAKCEHFGLCGGCKWQHLSYKSQLRYKNQQVIDAFQRIGKLDFPEPLPIIGSENGFHYRNKMEYTFSNSRWILQEEADSGDDLDKNAVGFHIPGRYDKVLNLNTCHLQEEPTNEIRNWIAQYAKKEGLSFYDVKNKEGLLRNLIIRNTTLDEWMLLFSFGYKSEQIDPFLEAVASQFPKIQSILFVINDKPNDTIYDLDVVSFKGNPWINEKLGDFTYKIRAKSFFQTNSHQAKRLYDVVANFAEIESGDKVYDLYCGTGTIGLYLSKEAGKIVGIESVPQAIEDAHENAQNNGVSNAVFEVGDMRKVFDDRFVAKYGRADIIITDPPRSGMHKDVVEQLNHSGAPKIIYVSCNVATQARDLDLMREHYKIERVQPVDMFPQTHHVENVVLLTKI